MRILLRDRQSGGHRYFLMAYSTVLCSTNMIIWVISSHGTRLAWIDYRNFPGGPIGFFESSYLTNIDIVAGVALVLGNILADALLVSKHFVALIRPSHGRAYSFTDVTSSGVPRLDFITRLLFSHSPY